MLIDDVMSRDVSYLQPEDNTHTAARRMRDLDVGFLPVCDADRRPMGALTDRDLVLRVCAEDHRPSNTAVRDVMTYEIISCHPLDDLERAEELMADNHVSRVMVLGDDGTLVGVVSLADIVSREEEEENAARTYREVASREVHT